MFLTTHNTSRGATSFYLQLLQINVVQQHETIEIFLTPYPALDRNAYRINNYFTDMLQRYITTSNPLKFILHQHGSKINTIYIHVFISIV